METGELLEAQDWDEPGEVEVILDGPEALQRAMVRRADGATKPRIEVFFRLAGAERRGLFRFETGAWSMVLRLAYDHAVDRLEAAEGPVRAVLSNGDRPTLRIKPVQQGLRAA